MVRSKDSNPVFGQDLKRCQMSSRCAQQKVVPTHSLRSLFQRKFNACESKTGCWDQSQRVFFILYGKVKEQGLSGRIEPQDQAAPFKITSLSVIVWGWKFLLRQIVISCCQLPTSIRSLSVLLIHVPTCKARLFQAYKHDLPKLCALGWSLW